MEIIVNHLTRMRDARVCVAGLDHRGRQIRPIPQAGHIDATLVKKGILGIGNCLDLGPVRHDGVKQPHIEDTKCVMRHLRSTRRLDRAAFWRLLDGVAQDSLTNVFGPDLVQRGRTCVIPKGKGIRSLGCLRVGSSRPVLSMVLSGEKQGVRMELMNQGLTLNVSVTDIRLYEANLMTPRKPVIDYVAGALRESDDVILSVGVGRPWSPPGQEEAHYLQVNNIFLSSDPFLLKAS